MLTELQVLSIAKDALKHFKLDCEIRFLPYAEFVSVAKKSPLIAQVMEEGTDFDELKIPALIHHEERDHIYLCKKVLNELISKQPLNVEKSFVKSVIYHELFHILYEHEVEEANFIECLKSEDRVCDAFKVKYPELHKIGFEIHKKATCL